MDLLAGKRQAECGSQITAEMGLSRQWEKLSESHRGLYQEPTGTSDQDRVFAARVADPV